MDNLLKMPEVKYCEFKKGEHIIRQGEKLDYVYYLKRGTCYRTIVTLDGDEIILKVKDAKNDLLDRIIGLIVIFNDEQISSQNFIAKSRCLCYRIPKGVFLNFVADKPELLLKIIHRASNLITELGLNVQSRKQGKVANRLCELLLRESRMKDNQLLINRFINTEVSGQLGINKITVSRILRVLKEEGTILKTKEGIYITNEQRLRDYAQGVRTMKY